MSGEHTPVPSDSDVAAGLQATRALIADSVAATPFRDIPFNFDAFVGGGKMLRGRTLFRLGPALGLNPDDAVRCAASVELCHAASLLHDDVIDGGRLRRHAPAFWTRYGAAGAILAGDLLLSLGATVLNERQPGDPRGLLTDMIRHMCSAEVEQEMVLRGRPDTLATAERIARGKTGALFAFAAAAAAPGRGDLFDALEEAGYLAGIAYQFSDDILDISGNPEAGKDLGRDGRMGKVTAAHATDGGVSAARDRMDALRAESRRLLEGTPADRAWAAYWEQDLAPAIAQNVSQAMAEAAS